MTALVPTFGWSCARLLCTAALRASAVAFVAVPVAMQWFSVGHWLGRRQAERAGKPD